MAKDRDPEIANAYDLFGDDEPPRRDRPGRPAPKPPPASDTFDLEGGDSVVDEEVVPPVPAAPARPRLKRARPDEERKTPRSTGEEHHVDEVWSRGAEWGPTLVLLAIVGVAVVLLTYMTFSVDHLSRSFLILLVGGAVWVALAYPIAITIERPVRITPEQAVKDYFAAASHHFPHYRRMWLLLSATGRDAREFATFPTFRDYWKGRIKALKGDRIKATTPLVFKVEEFKSEKSAGQSFVEATYRVDVFARGDDSGERLDSIRFDTSLVKGPDKMWYLNEGAPRPSGS